MAELFVLAFALSMDAFAVSVDLGAKRERKPPKDIADYDRVYKRVIKIAPLSDVSSSFAMERIKSTTALPL